MAKFLRRTKHYLIAAEVKQFSISLLAHLAKAMPLLFDAIIVWHIVFMQKFSAKNSAMTELSSLGLERNRTLFAKQFRLHSIDRNYLKSAIND